MLSTISNRLKLARRSKPRRGSVLLLALGVLAVLSISAVAYVTIVRLDRAGAVSVTRRSSYQQQVDKVIQEVQSQLVADLFGNKIVTATVPPTVGPSGERGWPAMFEDSEWWDSPTLESRTFTSVANPDPRQLGAADRSIMSPGSVALPDDAWLASTEPDWVTTNLSNTNRFRQITNLRAAYRWYDPNLQSQGDERWVRGDGRYVDLAQWFLQHVDGYADPSINLVDWTTVSSAGGRIGPAQGNALLADAATYEVFNRQVNALSSSPSTTLQGPVAPSDERSWVDTDGDLRADARWQVIDALGNVGGLNWVVAARIVDGSALININSAIELGSYINPDTLGDGATPADVDLVRLLRSARLTTAFSPAPPETDKLLDPPNPSFRAHLVDGLGLRDVFEELVNNSAPNNPFAGRSELLLTTPWSMDAAPLTRLQRRTAWEYLGQSPLVPRARQARAYPNRDLSDLMAFWGTNNSSMVSRVEQYIDGPEEDGYLPSPTVASIDIGPLRAKESSTEIRRLVPEGGNSNDARPTLAQLHDSTRRFLTTASGVGRFSPVPVLNPYGYEGVFALERVPVDQPLSDEAVKQAFASFAWALAPLATNMPVHHDLMDPSARRLPTRGEVDPVTGAVSGNSPRAGLPYVSTNPSAHYGGAAAARLYGPTSGAAYALVTSASLAVNLADAVDSDSTPTVRALIKDLTPRRFYDGDAPTLPGSKSDISMTLRLPQGDVEPAMLGTNLLNAPSDPAKPILVVGLERQPYLREVVASSFFREDGSGAGTGIVNGVVGDSPAEYLGCFIAVEIVNPHSTRLSLDGLSVVIPETPTLIDDASTTDDGPIRLLFPNGEAVAPGGSRVFAFVTPADGSSVDWDVISSGGAAVDSGLRNRLINAGASVIDYDLTNVGGTPDERRMWFHGMTLNPAARPVLLMRNNADGIPAYVIDRLSVPNPDADVFPPSMSENAVADGVVLFGPSGLGPADRLRNYNNDRLDATYFTGLGYDGSDERIADQFFSGQVVVTGSLQRMSVRGGANAQLAGQSGFSTAVMEFAPRYLVPGTATELRNTGRNLYSVSRDGQAWLRYDPLDIRQGDGPNDTSRLNPQDVVNSSAYFAYDFPNDQGDLSLADKAADGLSGNPNALAADDIASFQLLIPNGPLNDASEVLRVTPMAHLCFDCDPDLVDTDLNDLTRWRTAGEQMALQYRADPRPASEGGPADTLKIPNQYVASLNTTSSILGVSPSLPEIPETMRVPLALRVPDCFESLRVNDALVQGRININTAPQQVLHTLPLLAPEQVVSVGGGTLQAAPSGVIAPRVELITRYRDPLQTLTPTLASDPPLFGQRGEDSGEPAAVLAATPGFVTPAEVATLANWDSSVHPAMITPLLSQPGTFVELGADSSGADSSPLQSAARAGLYATSSDNPIDDPEEKLALYRALSNIATSRSDVYVAWFVLRGYDPETIERIPVSTSGDATANALNAMDIPMHNFRPAYESRWLVVFDRSQTESGAPIRRPTDRPRVLLRVELPSVGQ